MSHYCLSGEPHPKASYCGCTCSPCEGYAQKLRVDELQRRIAETRYIQMQYYRDRLQEEREYLGKRLQEEKQRLKK